MIPCSQKNDSFAGRWPVSKGEDPMATEKIRESIIAGSWYPGDPMTLKQDISRYLDQANVTPVQGEILGLIVPHAGYMYSGGVAAHAYKLLKGRPFHRVVILAPSHRAYFKGASVYPLGGYRTPLGVVPLDHEIIDALLQHPSLVEYVPQADAQEHSLEIQLPFLQVALQDFKLTPIVMGSQSIEFCRRLAELLATICKGKNTLVIASSDLSHFHADKEARELDQKVVDRVSSYDPDGLWEDLQNSRGEACGVGPILTLMLMARSLGPADAKVLHYANSGDITGDKKGVVGYMAAAVYRSAEAGKDSVPAGEQKVGVDLGLTEDEKMVLREVAVQTIRNRCLGKPVQELPPATPKLKEHRGAFVCIHKGEELRGCIGMIEGRGPLLETIRDMAIQAAFFDPRFCALQPEELDEINVELSILTPMERITDPARIQVGKHGLWLRKGHRSGLLLPQVATEHGWDRETFLQWTCSKAGLPSDAWRDPETEIYIFSADIF